MQIKEDFKIIEFSFLPVVSVSTKNTDSKNELLKI